MCNFIFYRNVQQGLYHLILSGLSHVIRCRVRLCDRTLKACRKRNSKPLGAGGATPQTCPWRRGSVPPPAPELHPRTVWPGSACLLECFTGVKMFRVIPRSRKSTTLLRDARRCLLTQSYAVGPTEVCSSRSLTQVRTVIPDAHRSLHCLSRPYLNILRVS